MNNDNDGNPIIGSRDKNATQKVWQYFEQFRVAIITSCLSDYLSCEIYYTKWVAANLNNVNYFLIE